MMNCRFWFFLLFNISESNNLQGFWPKNQKKKSKSKSKSKSASIVATYIFTAPTCTITIITSEPDYWETIISE